MSFSGDPLQEQECQHDDTVRDQQPPATVSPTPGLWFLICGFASGFGHQMKWFQKIDKFARNWVLAPQERGDPKVYLHLTSLLQIPIGENAETRPFSRVSVICSNQRTLDVLVEILQKLLVGRALGEATEQGFGAL